MKKNIFWIIGGLALLIVAVWMWMRRSRQHTQKTEALSEIAEIEQQLEAIAQENEALKAQVEVQRQALENNFKPPLPNHLSIVPNEPPAPPIIPSEPAKNKGRQKACPEEKAAYELAQKEGTLEAYERFARQQFRTKSYRGKAGQMIAALKKSAKG